MRRDDRLTQIVQDRPEFLGGHVLVRNHALQHEAAIRGDIGEELPFSKLVVVGQKSQQRRARYV